MQEIRRTGILSGQPGRRFVLPFEEKFRVLNLGAQQVDRAS